MPVCCFDSLVGRGCFDLVVVGSVDRDCWFDTLRWKKGSLVDRFFFFTSCITFETWTTEKKLKR